jgi:phosphate transport system protein
MTVHRHFDDELTLLKERLLRMGSIAETALYHAIDSLVKRNPARLPDVFALEREVNALEVEIDERAMTLIARRQPMAADLRLIIMAIKIAGEVERVSDQAVNVAQSTEKLLAEPPLKKIVTTPVMAERALKMLRESLDAFVRGDADLARRVIAADDEVDAFRDNIFRTLITFMMEDPTTISRGLSQILISRNLERVADHATNIAEEVIYLVEGRDVRDEETRKPPEDPAAQP